MNREHDRGRGIELAAQTSALMDAIYRCLEQLEEPLERTCVQEYLSSSVARRPRSQVNFLTRPVSANRRTTVIEVAPDLYSAVRRVHGDVSRAKIDDALLSGFSQLEDRFRELGLNDYLGEEFPLAQIHARRPWREDLEQLRQCDRHGAWIAPEEVRHACSVCPCPVPDHPLGRRRDYCANDCKQAAYRARKQRKEAMASSDQADSPGVAAGSAQR